MWEQVREGEGLRGAEGWVCGGLQQHVQERGITWHDKERTLQIGVT